MPRPDLFSYLAPTQLQQIIQLCIDEDLGPQRLDITSLLTVPAQEQGEARFRSRQGGCLAGAALLPAVCQAYDPNLRLTPVLDDGARIEPGSVVAQISGPLRSLLAVERVALNFLTHLSGIASLTARYVAQVSGTRALICDTRKTHAGLRSLEKYAVACGGGTNHRIGLFDAVLIKDNHLAHLPLNQWPATLSDVISQARTRSPAIKFVQIEVDSIDQLRQVLPLEPDLVLLDNMTLEQLQEAVALRNAQWPRVQLEASGGVNLDTVAAIAATGVDRISVGALTHSAVALDLGLDIP